VLAALAVGAAPALANPAPDPRKAAAAHFERGQTLYNLGKLDEAIVELEAAYQLDPDPVYLFNLAQAHRLRGNLPRAIFYYRRYLALSPDAPNRAEVTDRIAALEAEQRTADADHAALERARAELEPAALERARAALDDAYAARRHRVGLEVGWSQLYLGGLDNPPPQLVQGATYAYRLRHLGRAAREVGATFHETTIPYASTRGAASASYSQLMATGTLTHPIAWRLAARGVLGLGASTLRNLKQGNPVTPGNVGTDPQGLPCARLDLTLVLRLHPLFEATYTIAAASFAPPNDELASELKRIVTLEGFHVGLHVRL
jgi:tetratricopeptide (TPR) repeat protein